ncbi:unnamed protein product [Calypogeia fissa]
METRSTHYFKIYQLGYNDHAPPPYDVSKHSASCSHDDPDSENRKYIVQDEYGTSWMVDADELFWHREEMRNVEKRMSEGFAVMAFQRYYEAVRIFDGALSRLWECHTNKPLDLYIKTHRGHAHLRAALLESPISHGQSTIHLLDESSSNFPSCIATLSSLDRPLHSFNRSLLFSGLLGLAWISYFRGNMEEAEHRIAEAQTVKLEPSHFRADRDIDTIFFQVALQRFKGDGEKFKEWKDKFGLYFPTLMRICFWLKRIKRSAEKSKSLLLQAAALVGLGNVHMRLSIQDQEAGSNSVSSHTKISGGAEGSQLEFEVARKHYMKALEIYTDLGYKEGQRIVHCNLGNHHKRKDLQQALNQYKTATMYFSRMMHGGPTALLLHLKFVEVYLEMESCEAARESLQRAAGIPQELELVAVASVQHLMGFYFLKKGLAKERMKQGGETEIEEATQHFSVAAKHHAEIEVALRFYSPLWVSVFEQHKETYEFLPWGLTWQREKTSAVEALVWCERSRSRVSMVEKWHAFFPSFRDYLSPEVGAALTATASSKFDSLSLQESWENLQLLLSKCPLPAATVVEYVLCTEFGLLLFILDLPRGNPKMVRVSSKEVALEEGNLDRKKLTALKPKQIIVIPHEVLFRVHFHALIDGEKLVQPVKKFDLPDDNQWRTWLVVGINSHKVAKNLYYAEAEAKEVAAILSQSLESSKVATPFLGSGATKDEICKHLKNAFIVHFATHGIITEKYEQGGILFSDVDEKAAGAVGLEPAYIDNQLEENGTVTRSIENFTEVVRWYEETSKDLVDRIVLSADEIMKMNLEARLVVLSACQTASGVILGVAGLGRALLQAGVPSTVLSLWPVSDTSTRELMKDFYRLLVEGWSVAHALQSAMTSMIAAPGKKYSGKSRYNVRQWAAFLPFGLPSVQIVNRPLQLQPDSSSTSVRDLLKPLPLPLLVLSAVAVTVLKLSGRKP